MSTLLIPLVGPLQAWSVDARFGERLTAQEPSKSAVIGLVCAALGRDRTAPIDDLAAMPFGVRVDRPGVLMRDYHTAQNVASSGSRDVGTVLSNRWYLSDAAFMGAFEGPEPLLQSVQQALGNPVWPVFLGRKAFVPSIPLAMPNGLVPQPLEMALEQAAPLPGADTTTSVRLVVEDPLGTHARPDQPTGTYAHRVFAARRVRIEMKPWNLPVSA